MYHGKVLLSHGKSAHDPAEMCREEKVDDRVGSRVQGSQTLDEGGDGNRPLTDWNKAVDLKEIPDKVWTPAQNKD